MKVRIDLDNQDIEQFLDKLRQIDELIDSFEELKDMVIETRKVVENSARKN
jgi:hypothetical protein